MVNNPGDRYIFLADQPELLPILADWFYDEWGRHNPQSSRVSMQRVLGEFLNRDQIPLTIVRLRDSEPIASASLKIREMDTHPQYLHWLGGVYVHPEFRGQGIGSRLVQYTAHKANELKVKDLYLYTRKHLNFYARLEWQVIEEPHYQGQKVSIMKRNLSVDS